MLLKYNLNLHAVDRYGNNVVDLAEKTGDRYLVELLKEAKNKAKANKE